MAAANHALDGPESPRLDDFLKPLEVDLARVVELTNQLTSAFDHLSAHSLDQFLPTPISESILRPVPGQDHGRYVHSPRSPICSG